MHIDDRRPDTDSCVNNAIAPRKRGGSSDWWMHLPRRRGDALTSRSVRRRWCSRCCRNSQTSSWRMFSAWKPKYKPTRRDAVMPVTMMKEGRLSARSPCLSHRGDQEETPLVDKDDVGTQPRSVVFTRGQLVCFQRSMRPRLPPPARDVPASGSSSRADASVDRYDPGDSEL